MQDKYFYKKKMKEEDFVKVCEKLSYRKHKEGTYIKQIDKWTRYHFCYEGGYLSMHIDRTNLRNYKHYVLRRFSHGAAKELVLIKRIYKKIRPTISGGEVIAPNLMELQKGRKPVIVKRSLLNRLKLCITSFYNYK